MTKTILVVDDNEDFRLLNKKVLELEGYRVLTAESGVSALSVIMENKSIDLILLDVNMLDMSGPDFLEILQKEIPEVANLVPVVLLTGLDEPPKTIAKGFIRKALNLNQFIDTVEKYLFG